MKPLPVMLAVASLPLMLLPGAVAGEPDQPARRLRVVVFGGHPDDPESGAGGLIATLTRQGHEVIAAYGTTFRGDRRFFGRPEGEVRREEATAACKALGATPKFFPAWRRCLGPYALRWKCTCTKRKRSCFHSSSSMAAPNSRIGRYPLFPLDQSRTQSR